eukprot:TRINITY_DN11279_c0_g1_i1.p1 TRINITY_DN11279_c0_g1~~TRINITY_DN11279_c0_g1_i1.p1  ORF type:complete len:336 (-),score=39.07 TRINITY_DN11279_c0_g1_i1:179-1186(-)
MDAPVVGLGTMLLKESAEDAVGKAIETGCNLIDTGEHYGNLELIGEALKASAQKPFLIMKLSGMPTGEYDQVQGRVRAMLNAVGVARADLCLIHWPGLCAWDPTDMSPLESPSKFQGKASTWEEFCENIESAWAKMTRLKEDCLISEIGTSNFYAHHLDELSRRCGGAIPFANEIFIDAYNQEREFVCKMQAQGIRVVAYRPVMYKPFPEQVKAVADRHSVSAQSVVLAWLLGRGVYPIVKCRGAHIEENFTIPIELKDKLTEEDLRELSKAEVGLRCSAEWFAKIWNTQHMGSTVSEEDVQMLVGMGVDEGKARAALEKYGGNLELAMDAAFAE